MHHTKHLVLIVGICFCSFSGYGKKAGNGRRTELRIRKDITYQVIDNFSASDAWRTDFIGKYWPLEKRERIADLLFSTGFDAKGNPAGMGLSNWRVNIGAGSAENTSVPDVTNSWNRTECFLSPDGHYDFSKQAGQQWFMKAARNRGMNDFLFFTNSAPYFMTRSGSTLAPDRKGINLQPDKFAAFADFLAKTAGHFLKEGYNINYISPINEPQIDWGQNKNQEGSFATNADVFKVVTELDNALRRDGLRSEILFGEAADMKYLFECDSDSLVPDNLIETFCSAEAPYPVLNMERVYDCISAHDYWSAYPAETLVGLRKKIGDSLARLNRGTKFWASEYCILESNEETAGPPSAEKSIGLGLYAARIIHTDLAVANASAWQWWTAVSLGEDVPVQLIPKENCRPETLKYDGDVRATKMLWATGNFSFFIRPGMHRISMEPASKSVTALEAATSLMYSAYSDGKKVVAVFVNYSREEKEVRITCGNAAEGKMYVTSAEKDLEYAGLKELSDFTIPARSVVTVVI